MANRLADETSPYLLQHKDNPVDWYPWGEEAFQVAEMSDRPIFLSIGYSTCHWCHVMERESFEDQEVARLMNEAFVSVKVDREERPDVDSIYMSVCQLVGGSCGWPLNVVMTPDRQPFFVGTYFPRDTRGGRIGMTELVPRLSQAWNDERDRITDSAANIVQALTQVQTSEGGAIDRDWLTIATEQLLTSLDRINGGFGSRPKFPTPHNILFLLRSARGDEKLLDAATLTLDRMATGGIHDHAGGGFHRYSTDVEWRLPHFEKMLYDQALLLMAFSEGYAATGFERYRQVSDRIATYLERDLMSSDGRFFTAEDADSEGVEGKFYVWSKAEYLSVASEESAALFDIAEGGNFAEEATGEYTGDNVLHMTSPVKLFDASEPLYGSSLVGDLDALRQKREHRVRPGLDTKVLTDWNGLMVAGLAIASRALGNEKMLSLARGSAMQTLRKYRSNGGLIHVDSGSSVVPGLLDDYAFSLWSAIELFQTTFEATLLEWAVSLAGDILDRFQDSESGGLFQTEIAGDLIVRPRDMNDGAIPSGNAVSAFGLARMYRLTGDEKWLSAAEAVVSAAAGSVSRYPAAFTGMLLAVKEILDEGREIVVVGKRGSELVEAALTRIRNGYEPTTVIHFVDPANSEEAASLVSLAGFLGPMIESQLEAVYICSGFACDLPITSLADLPERM